jgi:cold shock CspA family protein
VVVLIAADGDYVPLVRKLNALDVRVMVLGWDFEFTTEDGKLRETKTSQKLLNEATYPILMNKIIDDRSLIEDELIDNLFVQRRMGVKLPKNVGMQQGKIKALKEGYGFVKPADGGPDCFFHWSDLNEFDFNELVEGMTVNFRLEHSEKGPIAKNVTPAE